MHKQNEKSFKKALRGEDELGVVLRVHIFVETTLNDILFHSVPYPKDLDKMKMTYRQRVDLTIAMGLDDRMRSPLYKLGNIRNQFAHNTDAHLGNDMIDSFYNSFSKQDKNIIQSANNATKKDLKLTDQFKWKKLNAIDKFILLSITLRSALLQAVQEAKERNKLISNDD